MTSLVVIGAGPIGAAAAQHAAGAGLATRIVLVDAAADLARGLALDLCQSGAVTGTSSMVEGTSDTSVVIGARLVIVADKPADAGEWRGDEATALVASVRALNPSALIVCAGAGQDDVVERAVHERGLAADLLVGSAPEALRQAMTALAALEATAAPWDISLAILGRGPTDLFVPWEGASVGGTRATDVLSPPLLGRLDRQLPFLWPPGPLALGAAAAHVARLAMSRRPDWVSLFVVPAGDGGRHRRGVAMSATLRDGRVRPMWPVLAPRDRVRFESVSGAAD